LEDKIISFKEVFETNKQAIELFTQSLIVTAYVTTSPGVPCM